MTLWLVRAGRYGEREEFAIENNVAVIGWPELSDLSKVTERSSLTQVLLETYPEQQKNTLRNWESQIWPFIQGMEKGDLVALPLKQRSVIAIGQIVGEYSYVKGNPSDARHVRGVRWLKEFPRNQFEQDLLYSFGAFMTVCRIKRNNAEQRVRDMLAGRPSGVGTIDLAGNDGDEETLRVDLERIARDQISEFINRKFKGHGLSRLVGAILQAQGYQVKVAPEGPDGGVDIIAGKGALGFEHPRLIVQVKSGDSPVDVSVFRELQGVMSSFNADQGLIVAWGGYRGTVEREAARQYFKIRLWDADILVQQLQQHYNELPDDVQAELPLKRIWTLVLEEE